MNDSLTATWAAYFDPCAAVRARFTVPPHERRTVGLALCSPPDRTAAADMLEKYSDAESYSRAAELSRLRARTQLEFMGLTADESFAIMRVAAYLAFANAPRPETSHTQLDRKSLWQLGISGDLPILLVELDENAHYDTARNAIRYVYMLRHLGMECDLIIICAGEASTAETRWTNCAQWRMRTAARISSKGIRCMANCARLSAQLRPCALMEKRRLTGR